MNNKTDNSSPTDHRFSFHSANGMLPLVKSIAKDVFRLHTEIVETQERLAAISVTPGQSNRKSEGPDSATPTPYSKEVHAIAETVLKKQNRLDACVKELTDLNLASPETGKPFVDFPAIYDNQDVCLCWKIGEPKIAFWHLRTEGCDKRRPVDMALIPKPNRIELSGSL